MLLKVENIKKNYKKFELNCSLKMEKGQVIGLIGQNGAGKSTTFKAILNLIKIESGDIEIFGTTSDKISLQQKGNIGVVMAEGGFSEYLLVKDIIPILESFYKDFSKEEFLKKCEAFNIPLDKKIKEFSTGMKAKLKVLIAISHKAQLLILDEPTAGLDVIARGELLDMLRTYMSEDEERGILISSHISGDLEGLCDEIYMIDKGRIVLHEETDEILSDYALLKITDDQYKNVEHKYLLKIEKVDFGYRCLTNKKEYYVENYPDIIIEKGNIYEVITMMIKGE